MAMEILPVIAIFISVVSFCVSSYSASQGHKLVKGANDLTNTSNNMQMAQVEMQMAQVEMQIRQLISDARNRYEDLALVTIEGDVNDINKLVINSAHENFLNAYDEACAKYNDGKVDKIRFKKLYHGEIHKLVTDQVNYDKYYGTNRVKYGATMKVYNEWYDLENS